MASSNRSALLEEAGKALRVDNTEMPTPGPDDVVVKNRALSINPLDNSMAASGRFVKALPWVLGQDVAGEVHAVGSNVSSFKLGDRIVGHSWSLFTGKAQDGAFSLYSNIPAKNASLVPDRVAFTEAVVLPLAIDTATSGLFQEAPFLGLPWPTVDASPTGKTIAVYGASSAVGSMAVQLATLAGCRVIGIAGSRNFSFVRSCGAEEVFDYKSESLVDDVVRAAGKAEDFVGIYDAIASASTFSHDLSILDKLEGGRLAAVHPLPDHLPSNVQGKQVFGLGAFSFPIWKDFVPQALGSGKLQCLPRPLVVGKGIESVQKGLDRLKEGVSAQKVVVEL